MGIKTRMFSSGTGSTADFSFFGGKHKTIVDAEAASVLAANELDKLQAETPKKSSYLLVGGGVLLALLAAFAVMKKKRRK